MHKRGLSRAMRMIAMGESGGGSVPHPLLTGLVAYWKLDEASTGAGPIQRNDSVGTSHLSDPVNTASAAGILSNGANFVAASTKYLQCNDNAALSMGDIDCTFSAWVKFTTVVNNKGLFGKWGAAGHCEYVLWYLGDHFSFTISTDGTNTQYCNATTFGAASPGTWYHVITWYDTVANRSYIQINNGEIDTAIVASGPFNSDSPFQIGAFASAAHFNGLVDEVGIWKRVLTPTERAALYNGGAAITFPFDGLDGPKMNDAGIPGAVFQSPYNWRTV